MAKMKCRLIVEATPINAKVVEILEKTIGIKETKELLETDCIKYIVNRLLEGGWFTNTHKLCNTSLVSKEHMGLVLSDYMFDSEAIEEGDVEIDAVDAEHYRMTYEYAAAALANDSELTAMVKHVHSIITPGCAEHVYHSTDNHYWVLDYIVRT